MKYALALILSLLLIIHNNCKKEDSIAHNSYENTGLKNPIPVSSTVVLTRNNNFYIEYFKKKDKSYITRTSSQSFDEMFSKTDETTSNRWVTIFFSTNPFEKNDDFFSNGLTYAFTDFFKSISFIRDLFTDNAFTVIYESGKYSASDTFEINFERSFDKRSFYKIYHKRCSELNEEKPIKANR